ncbi:MAG: OmpL47-type beta-barrel domain-containing protein [Thermoplasmata archaeon]
MKGNHRRNSEGCLFQRRGGALAFIFFLALLGIGTEILLTGLSTDLPAEESNTIYWTKVNSPIYINKSQGIYVVEDGQTLIIEAGVTVYFDDGMGIDVYGTLRAMGTVEEPVFFTKSPFSDYGMPWRSLLFLEDDGSELTHISVSMAMNGIYIVSSSLRIENSEIWSVSGSAIAVNSRMGLSSNLTLVNCSLRGGIGYPDLEIAGESWVTARNTSYERARLGDQPSVLERQWFLNVHVNNSLGQDIEGSLVVVEDNENGTASLSQATNMDGVATFIVREYLSYFGGPRDLRIYYTPHEIVASKSGYESVQSGPLWVGASETANIMLIDSTPPSTTLVVSDPNYGMSPIYVGSQTKLSFLVSGGGTGPAQTQYSIDGTSWVAYTGPFNLSGEGLHNVSYYSYDPANNTELAKNKMVYLDETPPTLSYAVDSQAQGSDPITISTGSAVSLYASDQGSGVSSITYSFDGESYQEYTEPLILQVQGYYNLSYRARDWIGNSAEENLWLKVVSPPPLTTNNPPYFVTVPNGDARVGERYNYQAVAVDPDGDDLRYSLTNQPSGMHVNASTGLVSWTPTEEQEGRYQVRLVVSDGEDIDVQIFFVTVEKAVVPPPPLPGYLVVVFGTLGTFALLGVSLVGFTEYGRFRFFLLFLVPLYSKLKKDEILNQFSRGQIYGYIVAYPGENYSSIKKALDVGNGTLTHHLYILEREGFVTSRMDGRYKRFYPAGLSLRKKPQTKLSMIQKVILRMIRQNPNLSQTEIAETLETSKQVVNYHIKALEKLGMIKIARRGSQLEYRVLGKSEGR